MSADDSEFMRQFQQGDTEMLRAYAAFSRTVFREEGAAIPQKFRELMAVAVSISMQCQYCIDSHTTAAVKAGATDAELAEAVWVAAAIGAGAAYTHGRLAFKASDAASHTHSD